MERKGDDADAPAFVVRNEQRASVSGLRWPGCVGCNHVYGHAEGCIGGNNAMSIRFKRLHPLAQIPRYAHEGDSGMDLCSVERCVLWHLDLVCIPTGIAIELPHGYEAQVRPRSGMTLKRLIGQLGTIDQGYRGEIQAMVLNLSGERVVLEPGTRIAQLVIAPVERAELVEVDELIQTSRGGSGFGSTGQ